MHAQHADVQWMIGFHRRKPHDGPSGGNARLFDERFKLCFGFG